MLMRMPAGGPAVLLERLLLRFNPGRILTPAEVLHHRVVTGGALLGIAVAVPAGLITWLGNAHAGAVVIGVFGLGCLALLAAARRGAPMHHLRTGGFWLVGGFLVLASLQSPTLHWEQFKWLALVPMLSLFLDDMTPDGGRMHRRFHALWRGTGTAIGLGLVVVVANRLGWTFGGDDSPSPMDFWVGLVDFVLFTISVAGLLSVHGAAIRRAQEELRMLRSMLSVCAWCRRIQDAEGEWIDLERYLATQTERSLTHGICPACERTALAELQR